MSEVLPNDQTGAATAATELNDADAEKLFGEFAQKADLRNVRDQGTAKPAETDGAATAPTAPAATKQPETKPATAADGSAAGTPPASAATPAQDEQIWANATPEQKAAFEAAKAWEHKYRSDVGRQSGFQRALKERDTQLAELKSELEQFKRSPQPGSAAPSGAASPSKAETVSAIRSHPKIKKALDEFPEAVEGLVEVLENFMDQTGKISGDVNRLTARTDAQVYAENESALDEVHPDWRKLLGSPEFIDWYETRPASIKDIVRRNGEHIVDAEEAADMVASFKQHLARTDSPLLKTPAPKAPNAPVAPAAPTTLADRRNRQLEASRASGPTSPAAASEPSPDDVQATFNHFAALREQKRRRAK